MSSWAFSFSHPGITKEDEERENAKLTKEQREAIIKDMYGHNNYNNDDNHTVNGRKNTIGNNNNSNCISSGCASNSSSSNNNSNKNAIKDVQYCASSAVARINNKNTKLAEDEERNDSIKNVSTTRRRNDRKIRTISSEESFFDYISSNDDSIMVDTKTTTTTTVSSALAAAAATAAAAAVSFNRISNNNDNLDTNSGDGMSDDDDGTDTSSNTDDDDDDDDYVINYINHIGPDDDDITRELIDELLIEIDNIPSEQKLDYQFALDFYPNLIEDEVPYKMFLRCENYNCKKAAQRIVTYWKMREDIFEDKAFYPLTTLPGSTSSSTVSSSSTSTSAMVSSLSLTAPSSSSSVAAVSAEAAAQNQHQQQHTTTNTSSTRNANINNNNNSNIGMNITTTTTATTDNTNTQSALSNNDINDFIKLGPNFFSVLPDDKYGRTVLCFDRTDINFKEVQDQLIFVKYMWFVVHLALQRKSTQINGIVYLHINRSSNTFMKRTITKIYCKTLTHGIPVRFNCIHCCYSSSIFYKIFFPFAKQFMTSDVRQRIKEHYSVSFKSPSLIKELDVDFGLFKSNLPISIGGTYKIQPNWFIECKKIVCKYEKDQHIARIKQQKHKQQQRHGNTQCQQCLSMI